MNTQSCFSCPRTSIALLALALAGPVAASDAVAPAAASDTTPSAEAPAAAEKDKTDASGKKVTEITGVTVTVERREQDLQKYAGTAQALSQDDLRGMAINNDIRNLQVAVPGLNISNQEGNLEIFIRGVGSANNTELGDPGAAPHVNGAYIPRPRGLGGMFYDLDRVEVNKGPQGTLRGRNALAGTLNIVTKKPDLDSVNGYVLGEVANRQGNTEEFGINLPLNDTLALRVAGYHLESDSSYTNVGDQRLDAAGSRDEKSGRISLLFKPNEQLSVFAMVDMGQEGGTGYPGSNIFGSVVTGKVQPNDFDLRRVVYFGPQGYVDSTNWGAQTTVTYDFGKLTLEYNGSYRDVDYYQVNANSAGTDWPGRDLSQRPLGSSDGNRPDYDLYSTNYWETKSKAQTQELRLFSNDQSRFRWTVGGFYFHENQKVGLFSLADKGVFYSGTEFTMPDVRGNSWAGYADGTFDVTEKFRVKAGVRYTEESKYRFGIGGNWTIGLGGNGSCCFSVRLGTPGFRPALTQRTNYNVVGLTPQQAAQFLLQGILTPGAFDTIFLQIGPIANGTQPNGGCVDRPDNNGNTNDCVGSTHSFTVVGTPSQQLGSSKFNFTDWRAGAEYDVGDDGLLYGTVSTGHKAGGFNDSFDINKIPETYKPESIIAYEVGFKDSFRLGGRKSTYSVAGFMYDYSDQVFQDLTVIAYDQFGNPAGYSLVNRNVGKSRLYGIEAESVMALGGGFTLQLNGLYLDSEIREGVVADVRTLDYGGAGVAGTKLIDLKGNELPLTSKFTLNARLQQTINLKAWSFDWQVLASYRSAYYLTQYNNRDVLRGTSVLTAFDAGYPDRQDGYTNLNAGIGFTSPDGTLRLEAFGSNLTNEDVSQKELVGSVGSNIRFLNEPRTYGLRVKKTF
jgi:iron complex outermembrane recepter protein